MLGARDVGFAYGDAEILKMVSLEVNAGETVALLGPSGSGKSTLLYCLAGILVPSSGAVTFNGEVLSDQDDRARTLLRRRSFGFVLQFGRLMADLTVIENVSFPLRLLGERRSAAERTASVALEAVGLEGKGDQRAATLSGGEQQRAAVARALVHDPSVIFADEPTGALDSANGALVMDVLLGMAEERGSAVVLVTHDESVASRADRQVHLVDGVLSGASATAAEPAHA